MEAVIAELVGFKLSLVGLAGFESFYPAQLSGGMRKRAALARAIALDPDFLFFDEPSAGLDPISARNLDELILELRASLGATVVIVTHELASIYAIATAKTNASKAAVEGCKECKVLSVEDTPIGDLANRMGQLTTSLLSKYGSEWTHSIAVKSSS